jgi:acyl-coenzyme A thioesterase PaaI-like protein
MSERARPGTDKTAGAIFSLEDFSIRPHNCFACGELNEAGLHLQLNFEPDRCWTELTLPDRYEGWEGVVHGGIVSTILDEVMGWSLIARDSWGKTARFSMRFRKPVTVGRRIRAEGWVTGTRMRIQTTAGRITDADTGEELATAEATYLSETEERKRALKERYDYTPGGSRETGS